MQAKNIILNLVLAIMVIMPVCVNAEIDSETDRSFLDKLTIGGKTGLNFTGMRYSNEYLSDYRSSLFPRGQLGFFMEYYASDNFSARPEMLIIGKGQRINEPDLFYRFRSNYIDMRLPFLYGFGSRDSFFPYFLFGPTLGIAFSGNIVLDNWEINQSRATIAPFELGYVLGFGSSYPIKIADFKIIAGAEIVYNRGITNNFSSQERSGTAIGLNMPIYSIEGTRKNRGLEFIATLAIPLNNFKRKPKPEPEIIEVEQKPVVIAEEIDDRCYTIEEINALADSGLNILNKKICMGDVNFEFGKSTLNQASVVYLDKMVLLLERIPSMRMVISGHTDNIGAAEFNMNLSRERARAVYNYLIGKNVEQERLSYEYYGSTRPLVDNDTPENRQLNRRVEFMIIQD